MALSSRLMMACSRRSLLPRISISSISPQMTCTLRIQASDSTVRRAVAMESFKDSAETGVAEAPESSSDKVRRSALILLSRIA